MTGGSWELIGQPAESVDSRFSKRASLKRGGAVCVSS